MQKYAIDINEKILDFKYCFYFFNYMWLNLLPHIGQYFEINSQKKLHSFRKAKSARKVIKDYNIQNKEKPHWHTTGLIYRMKCKPVTRSYVA